MTTVRAARLPLPWVAAAAGLLVVAVVCGVAIGPASIGWWEALREIIDMVPGVEVDSGLGPAQAAIVREIRFPRVVLGAMLTGIHARQRQPARVGVPVPGEVDSLFRVLPRWRKRLTPLAPGN